jgi:hypothetical protein
MVIYNRGQVYGEDPDGGGGVSQGILLRVPQDPNWTGPELGPVTEFLAIPRPDGNHQIKPYKPLMRSRPR